MKAFLKHLKYFGVGLIFIPLACLIFLIVMALVYFVSNNFQAVLATTAALLATYGIGRQVTLDFLTKDSE